MAKSKKPKPAQVLGTIKGVQKQSLSGLLVQVYEDLEDGEPKLLGTALTDSKGNYEIRYPKDDPDADDERRGKDLFVRVLSPQGDLLEQSDTKRNAKDKLSMDLNNVQEPTRSQTKVDKFIVKGKVVSPKAKGVPNLIVQAYLQQLPGAKNDQLAVGKPVITDKQGIYKLSLQAGELTKYRKGSPDIAIKVHDKKGTTLQEAVRFDIGASTEVNLVLSQRMYQPPSEFETIDEKLRAELPEGIMLQDVKESQREQGISFLARKSGYDARVVATRVMAEKHAGEAKGELPPDFYYALMRNSHATDKSLLYRINVNDAMKAYKNSADNGIVPAPSQATVKKIKEAFLRQSTTEILKSKATSSVSTIEDMIQPVLKTKKARQKFVQLYFHSKTSDIEKIWGSVSEEFSPKVSQQLQFRGQLGYLTLNNAPLISKLESAELKGDPEALVGLGLYERDNWKQFMEGVEVPETFAGKDDVERRENYINWMSGQLALSYPTSVLADQVQKEVISVFNRVDNSAELQEEMGKVLRYNSKDFTIGKGSINRQIRLFEEEQNALSDDVKQGLRRIQRAYQLSPSDQVMQVLLDNKLDSAFAIARYGKKGFLKLYSEKFDGGRKTAELVYNKAVSDAGLISQTSISYLSQKNTPSLPVLQRTTAAIEDGVKTYPQLEELFGSLDFCSCGHCESILSPASYLVDLLQFIDLEGMEYDGVNPIVRLLDRRPDIEHLELTCENTNTVLPYIDLVNEILEYYIIHPDLNDDTVLIEKSIDNFSGYNIPPDTDSEDLLAIPQHINGRAYDKLKTAKYPLRAPFDRNLALVRNCLKELDSSLYTLLEGLRKNESIENNADVPYGWEEIWSEQLQISVEERSLLTDSTSNQLESLYGFSPGADLNTSLPNAKVFCKQMGISYKDLVEILKTRFINPSMVLLPALEFIQQRLNSTKTDDPSLPDEFRNLTVWQWIKGIIAGDGDIENNINDFIPLTEDEEALMGAPLVDWITDNSDLLLGQIVLTPLTEETGCGFDNLQLQYLDQDNEDLDDFAFWKLVRFIRLKNKLAISYPQLDEALFSLYQHSDFDLSAKDLENLDNGLADFLNRFAIMLRTTKVLKIRRKREWHELLSLWGPMDYFYPDSLYRKLFLTTSPDVNTAAFTHDFSGSLFTGGHDLGSQATSLQAALKIDQESWDLILDSDPSLDATDNIDLENISKLFRYGFLSRKLKISIKELIEFMHLSVLDPMGSQAYRDGDDNFSEPELLRFVETVQKLKDSDFDLQQLDYIIRQIDLTGKSGPSEEDTKGFLYGLRAALKALEENFSLQGGFNEEQVYDLFLTVYGQQITDLIFATINGRPDLIFSVDYTHTDNELDQIVLDVDSGLRYIGLENRLIYQGIMPAASKAAYDSLAGTTAQFDTAIQNLFDLGQAELQGIVDIYPEVQGLYDQSVSFEVAVTDNIVPVLRRLKTDNLLEQLSASLDTDKEHLNTLLTASTSIADQYVINSSSPSNEPALNDLVSLEIQGTDYAVWHASAIAAAADEEGMQNNGLNYSPTGISLPENPTAGDTISIRFNFLLEPVSSGFHSFFLDTDSGANIRLEIEGQDIDMQQLSSGQWKNNISTELAQGQFYSCRLEVSDVKDNLRLRWQRTGTLMEDIPISSLLPQSRLDFARNSYIRLLKSLQITETLELSAAEISYLVERPDFLIGGAETVLSHLPISAGVAEATYKDLFQKIIQLIDYTILKSRLEIDDDGMIEFWTDPTAVEDDGTLSWYKKVNWTKEQFDALAGRIDGLNDENDLIDMESLGRLADAIDVVHKSRLGISDLLTWVVPSPDLSIANELQNALRSLFEESKWHKVLQPVYDSLRGDLRDALVDYVLGALKESAATSNIDTPDKLFEYFLIDPLMEPCMKTSRIKQALSSTQLFINRCLLNLEDGVSPASIKAEEWEWKKRYRVAEAAKKVFLYPENWLDPSLRTTKSTEFKELEGELAQSDLNNDLATMAILGYLEKIDQIAHLQIVGMCRDTEDRIHVIGHTAGTTRAYYHRVYDGTWSAWEKISLDIDGNPVTPVYWKDRLFLFWLTVIPKGDETGQMDGKTNQPSSFDKPAVKRTMEITLNWSEYYNGKWKNKRTSDLDDPLKITLTEELRRNQFEHFHYVDADDESLVYAIAYQTTFLGTFRLYNKHSLPDVVPERTGKNKKGSKEPEFCIHTRNWRNQANGNYRLLERGHSPLSIEYNTPSTQTKHKIMSNKFYLQTDFRQPISDIFFAPFFSTDFRHSFFVEVSRTFVRIPEFRFLGPEIFIDVHEFLPIDRPWERPDPSLDPGYIDPVPWKAYMLSGQTYPAAMEELGINYVINDGRPIEFEGTQIGVHGQII